MSATDAGLLERPPDPHELIGTNWYEMDHNALAAVAARIERQAKAASTAEQKTHADTNNYAAALPEGFEAQIKAGHRVGNMAGELAKWLSPGAIALGETAQAIALAKLNTITTVMRAEALIAMAEFRIAQLRPVAAGSGPHASAAHIEIDALRRQIEADKDTARTAIAGIYEGVPEPVLPSALGLTPVIHTGPPAGTGTGNGGAINVKPASTQGESDGATALDNSTRSQASERLPGETDARRGNAGGPTRNDENASGSSQHEDRTGTGSDGNSEVIAVANQQPVERLPGTVQADVTPVPPSVSAPSTGAGTPAGGLGGASMPRVSSPVSNPLGGLGSSPTGGALSSGAPSAPSSAVPQTPAQQFLSGAAQGFSSQSPLASGAAAAAAQPFKPPPGSTMPAGPPPAATPPASSAVSSPGQAAQVQTPVSASPPPASSPPAAGAPPANAVPLAPPPAAGVPNSPPAAAPPPPVAPAAPAPPVAPPAPPVLGLGKLASAVKAASHVSHGEGLRPSLEFNTAVTLVAALHDPAIAALSGGEVGEWACAVFKRPDEPARFVVASREGLSWTPAGVYMPAGVTVAGLDPAVPYGTRKLWRGLRPPARVLAEYAKAIGEQPRIVVARHWLGLDSLFPKPTVVAADDQVTVTPPNLVLDPVCRHRLEVASPTYFWAQVCAIPDSDIAAQIRTVAENVVQAHDAAVTPAVVAELSRVLGGAPTVPPDLRAHVLAQIGEPGGEAVWQAVWDQMVSWRLAIMTSQVTAPNVLAAGEESAPWNTALVVADQVLRGWETLWLAQRPASREVLADMTYAAIGALNA